MKSLTIKEIEFTAFEIAQEHLSFNEPIPDFSTRFPNVLESCVAMPFIKYKGKDLYKGLIGKAAILLYLMIKNHPFQNGNKRIAITATLVYLAKNGKWLNTDSSELYDITIWVASSPSVAKDATVKGIECFLGEHIVEFRISNAE